MKGQRQLQSYLDYLYSLDYKERPVDVKTLITSEEYLGKITDKGRAIYDIWKKELSSIMAEDSLYLIVFTGAIGTGKTYASAIGIAAVMQRILCLKDPWHYFDLSSGGKMAIAFFNLTKTLSQSRGFGLLQSFLMSSPWFMDHSSGVRGVKDKYVEYPIFRYVLSSPYAKGFGTLGEDVVCAHMDELDSPTDSEKQKIRVVRAYEATVRRFESRFVIDDESLGKFFLVASKQEEVSFLNTFVSEMESSSRVHVIDIPLWEAKPSRNYCGEVFYVLLGDAYTSPKILESSEVDKVSLQKGKVISVPVEHRDDFERDIVGALRDLAGVSVGWIRKSKLFSSERFLVECYDETKKSPLDKYTISTGVLDEVDYIKHFDLSAIRTPKSVPRYIHLDIAFSGDGDAVGLAMSAMVGWLDIDVTREDGTISRQKAGVVETDFVVRIEAKSGDQVPTHKIRKLVLDLRSVGFNVVKFTSDLKLASNDTLQILNAAGIISEYFSLDRDVKAYLDFRDMVLEKRWIYCRNEFLHFELVNLVYDRVKGKVDHPDSVKDVIFLDDGGVKDIILKGSKDLSDAVAGSVVSALWSSETPADSETMVNLVRKASVKPSSDKSKYWWVDQASEVRGTKKEEDVIPTMSEKDCF